MARIVCQVLHRPNRVNFIWSDGSASFEPYHLQDQELESFYQAARAARQHLTRIALGSDAQAALELARAGHQLYKCVFRHDANDPIPREIEQWLCGLRDRNEIASLDMLGDVPGRIPWNTVYDQPPPDEALRTGDPAALRHFWGYQYVLAAGKRVNPLRVACVLEDPDIVLAADAALLDKLPAEHKNKLSDWASSHELTILDSVSTLLDRLRDQAPDILYLFAPFEGGGLRLGEEVVALEEVRDALANADEGNPDPVVFLQATGTASQEGAWECFLGAAVNTLTGVVMCEVPAAPALANVLGVEALTRFLQNQRLGQAVKEARAGQDLAALAYSAFCPSHVKIAGDQDSEPDVPGPEPVPLPEFPYRPLAAFESEDRALFTGREDDTVRCAGLVDEAATPGLVLHGAGGVGKSSFLRAGLVPHLETEAVGYLALRDRAPAGGVERESDYPVVALRPGVDLIGQLAEALCAFCAQPFAYTTPLGNPISVDLPGMLRAALDGTTTTAITAAPPGSASESVGVTETPAPAAGASVAPPPTDVPAASLWQALTSDPNLLAGVLDQLTRRLPFELVMVIEQAEDWVLERDDAAKSRRHEALRMLGAVLRSPARCKVILSVRTEFLGRLVDCFPLGPERWRDYFLGELDRERMLRAILLPTATEPVPYAIPQQKYQFKFEHDLADQVVRDAIDAARDARRAPLPILQILCADLYERMRRRKDDVITKADRKDLGPAAEAAVGYVNKKIKSLPFGRSERHAMRRLIERLSVRHTDGTVARRLAPLEDIVQSWKVPTPLRAVIGAAAKKGLVEMNPMLVEGRLDNFLSLPQEALAETAAQWHEERKRRAFGRTRIVDTLWIMIPLIVFVGAIVFKLTQRSYSLPAPKLDELERTYALEQKLDADVSAYKIDRKELEALFKYQQKIENHLSASRWPMYAGELARAEQAWNHDNPLLARQLLLRAQPLQTDMREFEWYYLWNKVQGHGPQAVGHKGLITSVAVTADGTLAASASLDGTVKLWNLDKNEVNATLTGHTGPVLAVAFSPDGKWLASGGDDKVIRVWDAAAGKDKYAVVTQPRDTLTGHTGAVRALAFGPEGLVSAGADKKVISWHHLNGLKLKMFEHSEPVQALAVAAEGKSLAYAGGEAVTLIRDGNIHTFKTSGPITALAFDEAGKTLATGGTEKDRDERGMIHFWDTGTGKMSGTSLQHASAIFALAYVPKTKLLASAGKDNLVRIWDPTEARQVSAYKGHYGWIAALAASGTGKLVTGSYDGTIKTWGAQPPDVIAAHKGPAQAVLFTPDGKAVISGGKDGTVKFWDSATGHELMPPLTGLGEVTGVAYSAKDSGATLAVGTWTDKEGIYVRFWEVNWGAKDVKERLKSKEAAKSHAKGVTGLAMSPDGATLASGSADQTVILWDVASGKLKHTLGGHQAEVRCVAFSAEGRHLATGTADGKVRNWRVASGTDLPPAVQAHSGPVNAVAYWLVRDEALGLATAGEDRSTKFWAVTPKSQAQMFKEHRSNAQSITALAVSPNGRFAVTGSLDRSVKLFGTRLQSDSNDLLFPERFTFTGMDSPVRAVAVSADSLVVAGACDDGTLRFWRAAAAPKVAAPAE